MLNILPALNPILLGAHNILRWLILLAGVWAVVGALVGWLGKREWRKSQSTAGMLFAGFLDLQVLLGLLMLVFTSGLMFTAVQSGQLMSNSLYRYFSVEHSLIMLVALAFAHIGSAQVKKSAGDRQKYQKAALWYGLALLAILAMIPWPFTHGRPWLPF